ncbi:MAG: DUF1475 domain-containing protein [Proteobacteria bacterium]|nr:MAG: DUF1475 domain-containing protein [Pseudomonadota bacterium]
MKYAALFSIFVLLAMIAITTSASLEKPVMDGFMYLLQEKWGVATLMDAYFGFTFFYLWVAYREVTLGSRLLWLVFIMSFGTIAMAIYVLNAIRTTDRSLGLEGVLLRKNRASLR